MWQKQQALGTRFTLPRLSVPLWTFDPIALLRRLPQDHPHPRRRAKEVDAKAKAEPGAGASGLKEVRTLDDSWGSPCGQRPHPSSGAGGRERQTQERPLGTGNQTAVLVGSAWCRTGVGQGGWAGLGRGCGGEDVGKKALGTILSWGVLGTDLCPQIPSCRRGPSVVVEEVGA